MGKEKGFTILELLVAISILSIGLLSLATVLASGIGGNRFAHQLTVETSVSASILEELLSKDEGDTIFDSDVSGAQYDLDPDTASTSRIVQGRTYSASYSIDASNPVVGVARIDVTVTGEGRTVSSTAFKSTL